MPGDISKTIRKVRNFLFVIFMTSCILLTHHIIYVSFVSFSNEWCPFIYIYMYVCMYVCVVEIVGCSATIFLEFMVCNQSHKDVSQEDMQFYWAKYAVELFKHSCCKKTVQIHVLQTVALSIVVFVDNLLRAGSDVNIMMTKVVWTVSMMIYLGNCIYVGLLEVHIFFDIDHHHFLCGIEPILCLNDMQKILLSTTFVSSLI